jgi:hypothetical protein
VLVPSETAATTSARAVIDFEPGRRTDAVTGPDAVGAGQGTGVLVAIATCTVCRPP